MPKTIRCEGPSADQAALTILQWEIWNAIWLHEDHTSKCRPVLVVSTAGFNAHNSPWVVKISTKKHEVPHRIDLRDSDAAFKSTGLTETSYFYLQNVRQIPKNQIFERRGSLGVMSALMTAIALKAAIPKPLS